MTSISTTNPVNGAKIAEYRRDDEGRRKAILEKSREAQRAWAKVPTGERAKMIGAVGRALKEKKTELGRLATLEMGKPIGQATKEVEKSAAACDYYATNAEAMLADDQVPDGPEGARAYVAHAPLGTILCIMPWNFPFWQVLRFAAPAMAAGNAVILKHADNTTGVALAILNVMKAAGVPDGVFQVTITDHDALKSIIADPIVRAVSLTGSERAGAAVASLAGQHVKKTVLELGGSDPYVILDDADVERAAKICVDARYVNNGQSCVAAKRFIICPQAYDAFRDAFLSYAKKKVLGDPMDGDTDVGPMARIDLRDGVAKQVAASIAKGARALLGGPDAFNANAAGAYYPVTVLDGVAPGMAAFDEEIFGPAAALIRAKDETDAMRLANASRYGLGGAIFSRDTARAERLAREELDVGFATVNAQVQSDPRLPFGGVKMSGYGRELGVYGMREFVNFKTILVAR